MSRARPPRHCKRCDAPILFWRSAVRADGSICVDASPDDNGTVRKIVTYPPDDKPRIYGERLSGHDLAAAVEGGEMLWSLHGTTCPAARPPRLGGKPPGLEIDWEAAPSRRTLTPPPSADPRRQQQP